MAKLAISAILLISLLSCVFGQRTIDQVVNAAGCSTAVVNGLSRQLIDEMQCIQPGLMKSFEGNARIQRGAAAFPFLQTPAVDALIRVVNAERRTMVVNSGLRTLPQQFLLFRWFQLGLCGITAAAPPGRSNHNGGLALDINDSQSWITPMQRQNWRWFGPGDVPHFDFVGAGTRDIRVVSIQAFQRLWNRNNPNDQIGVDGQFGPATEARLRRSPSTGFAIGASCNPNTPPDDNSPVPCQVNGVAGTCIDTAVCTGTSTPGFCPGAANIQCCTGSRVQALNVCELPNGETGTCQSVASCTGTSTPGFCNGPNDIQCCTPVPPPAVIQRTNDAGLDLIKSFEGFEPVARPDPIGIATIGFGHNCEAFDCTVLRGKNANGNFVTLTVPLSREEGTLLLRADVEIFEDCVRPRLTRTVNANQFSALVSFTFNVGCGAFASSTLLRRVNAGVALEGPGGIREAFLLFNKAGGVVFAGLTRRRNAEADLFGGIVRSIPNGGNPDTGIGADCFSQGEKGVCLDISQCTGTRVGGLCPGGSNVQCCLRNRCTVNSQNDGICVRKDLCTGTTTAGRCFGAADVQCCTATVSRVTAIQCPPGTEFDFILGFCADAGNVYGPFPDVIVQNCIRFGGGNACNSTIAFDLGNGFTALLPRFDKGFFAGLRGQEQCPQGTVADSGSLGWCVETREQSDGTFNNFIFGGFDADAGKSCQELGGGASCFTPRWSDSFWRQIGTAKSGVSIIENNLALDPNGDEKVEVFIPFLAVQQQLNAGVEIPNDQIANVAFKNGCSALLLIVSLLFVLF